MIDCYKGTFSPQLTADLQLLSKQLHRGPVDVALLRNVVEGVGRQPLATFGRASAAISYYLRDQDRPMRLTGWRAAFSFKGKPHSAEAILTRFPEMKYLYLLDHSGWVREAALKNIRGALDSPFWLVVLAYRLNDWVPQIRTAAIDAFERAIRFTAPAIAADAIIHLIGRAREWQRWTEGQRVFHSFQWRPEVVAAVAERIVSSPTGPMVRVLRDLLRAKATDGFLVEIAVQAVQPAVRAVALDTLLRGQARWADGQQRRWIDKSMGLWRNEPRIVERPVERPASLDELLAIGASDRSPLVRAVAASCLIAHHELSSDPVGWASRFAADQNVRVRQRGQFFIEERLDR